MLKIIEPHVYHNLLGNLPLIGGLPMTTDLPENSYYAVMDESALGLRGVARVRNGLFISYGIDPEHTPSQIIQPQSSISSEHEKVNKLFADFPVGVDCFMRSGDFSVSINNELFFRYAEGRWSHYWEADDEIKSLLVEYGITENQLNSLLKEIEGIALRNVFLAYVPGKGLVFPGESKRFQG